MYRTRVGGGGTAFTASPIAADGFLYLTGESGDVYVVRAGPTFEVVARNALGEECLSSPAASEGVLYYRTRGHLAALERGEPDAAAGR